ncbi:flavodoxin domain-containing protein [Bacillus sp. BRMEA1]|uniref:flavodoxin domain-containing protein n=1 Tax=Neobacillus endophyticus TaxID=2738405 RepID=UPI0015642388|nr:flavodoxin domain-containing protein [Neobacillus endophyticus]NRD78162.1 flavodoxin domain-containing protein [Neobacillus endophyticus]
MKIAIVYSSKTGNTEELVNILCQLFLLHDKKPDVYKIEDFPLQSLQTYDGIIIGTYTWGDGDIPVEMLPLYEAFEHQDVKRIITGVFGTGDRFYPNFCGAVDEFRDMLFVRTNLAVTLKVELAPQSSDIKNCGKFVELFLTRLRNCDLVMI